MKNVNATSTLPTSTITAARILLGYCPSVLSYTRTGGDFVVGHVGPYGIDRLTAQFLFEATPAGAMWDSIIVLSELGGICPDMGWLDEVGLACAEWAQWGKEVDSFVDSW